MYLNTCTKWPLNILNNCQKVKGKNKRSTWDNDNDANFIEIKTFEPFFNFLK